MTDDLLSTPLTAHERALVLAGVEWMRAAACAASRRVLVPEDCSAVEAHGRLMGSMGASDNIRAIPLPALQPARIGVLGEG